MIAALRAYREVVAAGPLALAGLLALSAAAALLEGAALVLLIPLLEIAAGGAGSGGAGSGGAGGAVALVLAALAALGLPLDIRALAVGFGLLAALSALLNWAAGVAVQALIAASDAAMRTRLFAATMGLYWPHAAGEKGGEVVKAINSDPVQAGVGLLNLLLAATAAVAGLAYLGVALALSWQLTLATIAFGLVVLPAYLLLVRRARAAAAAASAADAALAGHAAEAVANAKLVFAQGLRARFAGDFAAEVERFRRARFRQAALVEGSRLAFELVAVLFVAGLLGLIAWFALLPVTVGLVFLAVFYRIAPRIVTVQGNLMRALAHAAWITDWLDRLAAYRRAAEAPAGTLPPRFEHRLELRGAAFAYPARGDGGPARGALVGVDLVLAHGEAVAILGPSGHGKTTLIDAICGLVRLDGGAVLLDGVDLAAIDRTAWQRRIGLVPQDAPLFHGSIRANILLGAEGAPDPARFARAAGIAGVDEFASRLPEGYDTEVGERGARLSGGQRQRVALARALYRAPDLLILDEATSALDHDTAARIVENLRAAKPACAMLIVSHEPTLLALADRSYRMELGRLLPVASAAGAEVAR